MTFRYTLGFQVHVLLPRSLSSILTGEDRHYQFPQTAKKVPFSFSDRDSTIQLNRETGKNRTDSLDSTTTVNFEVDSRYKLGFVAGGVAASIRYVFGRKAVTGWDSGDEWCAVFWRVRLTQE
jgi:hypothetical protein